MKSNNIYFLYTDKLSHTVSLLQSKLLCQLSIKRQSSGDYYMESLFWKQPKTKYAVLQLYTR